MRGMGHFYRALNLIGAMRAAGQSCKLYLNDYRPGRRLLDQAGIDYSTVDLVDVESDWEAEAIARDGIRVWINDRLDTDARHATNVTARGIPLVTFDDRGEGAAFAALHVAALAFDPSEQLLGRRVLRGIAYLILNPEIARHRRVRTRADRLIVTLGGSDTYGVTVKVINVLSAAGRTATVIIGPGFRHEQELAEVAGPTFEIRRGVPSLIAEFERHDLAITGGGITPFEANASGLPCIVIANETFEVAIGKELERLGGSVFAGFHSSIERSALTREVPIANMSRAGMEQIDLCGAERIVRELTSL